MMLILIAWVPETLQNWNERGRNLNLNFVALYLFGSFFLAFHALEINDEVFFTLNGLATLIALFNAWLFLANRRPSKPAGASAPKARKKK